MALDKSRLKTAIQTEIVAQFGAANDSAVLAKFAEAIANAVIDEITGNAVVTPTALLAPQNAGPVTGTGTVV